MNCSQLLFDTHISLAEGVCAVCSLERELCNASADLLYLLYPILVNKTDAGLFFSLKCAPQRQVFTVQISTVRFKTSILDSKLYLVSNILNVLSQNLSQYYQHYASLFIIYVLLRLKLKCVLIIISCIIKLKQYSCLIHPGVQCDILADVNTIQESQFSEMSELDDGEQQRQKAILDAMTQVWFTFFIKIVVYICKQTWKRQCT